MNVNLFGLETYCCLFLPQVIRKKYTFNGGKRRNTTSSGLQKRTDNINEAGRRCGPRTNTLTTLLPQICFALSRELFVVALFEGGLQVVPGFNNPEGECSLAEKTMRWGWLEAGVLCVVASQFRFTINTTETIFTFFKGHECTERTDLKK
jgi:hypothetical protein